MTGLPPFSLEIPDKFKRSLKKLSKAYKSVAETYRLIKSSKLYQNYGETVCTAGILLDKNEKPLQWIRIYPVRYRALDFEKKYKRWSIISAEIERNEKDFREESYRIDDNSISVIREIGTKNNWQERKSFVLAFQFSSTADIKAQGKSLGIIKPKTIEKYFCKKDSREWNQRQQGIQDQADLFESPIDLEKIPYKFGYNYTEMDDTKHACSIIYWEISQLYRNCRSQSKLSTLEEREKEAIAKVKQKLQDEFLAKKDIYFILGNLKGHPQNFMIIGLFYPLKPIHQEIQTLSLFDT